MNDPDYLILLLIGIVIVTQAMDDVVAGALNVVMHGFTASLDVLVSDPVNDQAVFLH